MQAGSNVFKGGPRKTYPKNIDKQNKKEESKYQNHEKSNSWREGMSIIP